MKQQGKEDQPESLALEIATQNLLKGKSLKELSDMYPYPPSTIHRRLKKWLDGGRFELIDRLDRKTMATVLEIEEHL